MSRSPIPRVLSILARHRARALLMGGQACILYGAAEFSRDVDVAVAVDAHNLARLRSALAELGAEPVYFPRLTAAALRRGHACHFRCEAPGLLGMRLDIMAVLRSVDGFESLWRRRVRLQVGDGVTVNVMSLEDLVLAKKTQRDKDWPMVRRLVESDITRAPRRVSPSRVRFWLQECRSPELLRELVRQYPVPSSRAGRSRAAVAAAISGTAEEVERELRAEEDRERAEDRLYWAPLRAELERLRLGRRSRD